MTKERFFEICRECGVEEEVIELMYKRPPPISSPDEWIENSLRNNLIPLYRRLKKQSQARNN